MPKELLKDLVQPVLEAVSERACRNLRADRLALVVSGASAAESGIFVDGDPKTAQRLEVHAGSLSADDLRRLRDSGPYVVYDMYQDSSQTALCKAFLEPLGCARLLLVPFCLEDVGNAFLVWGWRKSGEITQDHIEKAIFIAEQVALSLKLALKEVKSQELNAKLAALLELSTSIYSSLNHTNVLEKAINLAMKIVGADGGTIFTLDKKENLIRPLITVDENHEKEISRIILRPGEGLTGLAIQVGVGVISNHSESDPRAFHVPGTPQDEPESLISVPLTWSGEVIGAITLRSSAGKDFVQEDLDILTIFARQAADAIENAKLYENLEQAYRDLSNTQEQLILTEKLRALGEMAGGVAHDFNNVLGTILGRAQLLLREVTNERWAEQLKHIENVSLAGARTVQKLQNFTRVSTSGPFENVDLNKAVEDAVEVTRPRWRDQCQRQGIIIDLTFDRGELKPILGNRPDLVEAFSNILLNAVDALPNGGCIKIETFMDVNKAVVKLSDNGVGMEDDVLNRMFFPFFTTKGRQGTGMGLAVVYGIVARHKGEIDVTSKPGQGTTFALSFGAISKAPARAVPEEVEREVTANVLVIDDDENIRQVMGDMLEFLGHKAALASSGEEGIDLFKQTQFDIVVTDLGMPGISGWEVSRLCKSLKPEVPVVMISGWGHQIDEDMVKQGQLDGILAKPFEMNKIKSVIQRVLAKVA